MPPVSTFSFQKQKRIYLRHRPHFQLYFHLYFLRFVYRFLYVFLTSTYFVSCHIVMSFCHVTMSHRSCHYVILILHTRYDTQWIIYMNKEINNVKHIHTQRNTYTHKIVYK